MAYRWAESTRTSDTFGAELGECLLGEVRPFLGLLEFLLRLAVLGKIQRSDLLRLLDLPLVRFDLLLKLVDQILYALEVLTVLVRLETRNTVTSVKKNFFMLHDESYDKVEQNKENSQIIKN